LNGDIVALMLLAHPFARVEMTVLMCFSISVIRLAVGGCVLNKED
jgi:hypothetical protein